MLIGRNLLGLRGLGEETIDGILDTARGFKDISRRTIKKVPTLRGRTILNVFYEASTRTRVSFELAGKRLSADTINISASGSSVSKGESLLDMGQTLAAMRADAVVIRHGHSGAPHYLAKKLDAAIINAGDGLHEHPTQALLDFMTMREHLGSLRGKEVAIVGDIKHSRVARSNMLGLRTMGAKVRVAAPATLLPVGLVDEYGVERCATVEEAIEGAHVVMALRLQHERMSSGLLPSLREYAVRFGINSTRLKKTRQECVVMHPGPVNRGVELEPDVVDSGRSVILEQVENGVAVRCAVLYLVLGGDEP